MFEGPEVVCPYLETELRSDGHAFITVFHDRFSGLYSQLAFIVGHQNIRLIGRHHAAIDVFSFGRHQNVRNMERASARMPLHKPTLCCTLKPQVSYSIECWSVFFDSSELGAEFLRAVRLHRSCLSD